MTIERDGTAVAPSAPTLRKLLALLLVRANRLVRIEDLVDIAWPVDAPSNSRKAIQVYVHRLRQGLAGDERIVSEAGGYRLVTSTGELDSDDFVDLVAEARRQRSVGQLSNAAELLRQAQALWRGPAYEEAADHPSILAEAARLNEERIQAQSELIDIELHLGRHKEVLGHLVKLVDDSPYREDLRSHYMLALYRAGRQADALAAFRQMRQLLRDELGVEPGLALQKLHSQVLRSAPELDLRTNGEPAQVLPRQLPPAVSSFTGRTEHLAKLDQLVPTQSCASMPIALITGTGGVGKTALAVHWAQTAAARFPDGQLFVDLRGYSTDTPVRPLHALTSFLRSLGVPIGQVPIEPMEAAALFRSRVAGRRLLIVLDNAYSAEDVRMLLPGNPECMVLVTSRDRLTGLVARDGATKLSLDVMSPGEAQKLIDHLLGRADGGVGQEAAASLARACAYLPLALRVAIARIVDRPFEAATQQISRLHEGGRLQELDAGADSATAIRNTFALSYEDVPNDARLLFRRLGLVPSRDFTPETAAELSGFTKEATAGLLNQLAEKHLVNPLSRGRFGLHDLLREYATERCASEDDATAQANARSRLYVFYLQRVYGAGQVLYPGIAGLELPDDMEPAARYGFGSTDEAIGWLDAEHENIVSAILDIVGTDAQQWAWLLAANLRHYFNSRRRMALWFATARAGLAAARGLHDQRAQAKMHQMLGHAYGAVGRYHVAERRFTSALRLSEASGWDEGTAHSLGSLAVANSFQGRQQASIPYFRQAIEFSRRADVPGLTGRLLNNLANCQCQLGNLQEAWDLGTEAIGSMHRLNDRYAGALSNLGVVRHLQGRYIDSWNLQNEALADLRRRGNDAVQTFAMIYITGLLIDLGRLDEAWESANNTVRIARRLQYAEALTAGLTELGRYLHATGDGAGAVGALAEAVHIAERNDTAYEMTNALIRLADVQLDAGDISSLASASRAHDLATERGYQIREGQALEVMARIRMASGNQTEALLLASKALEIQQQTGHVVGEANARHVLGTLHPDPSIARAHAAAAQDVYQRTGTKSGKSITAYPTAASPRPT